MPDLPILYSFRRCPYAMRARLGLYYSEIRFEWREILLRDKPDEFLKISSDGTVPVLKIGDQIIQESLEIMLWALGQNDSNHMLENYDLSLVRLIDTNFKTALNIYKYSSRYEKPEVEIAKNNAFAILSALEQSIDDRPFGASDLAIFPFIRQFAHVDFDHFNAQNWPKLQKRLNKFEQSEAFIKIMNKLPTWKPGDKPFIFGEKSMDMT